MKEVAQFIILIIVMTVIRAVGVYSSTYVTDFYYKYAITISAYGLMVMAKSVIGNNQNLAVINGIWNSLTVFTSLALGYVMFHQKLTNGELVGLITMVTGTIMTQI